ncbi:MAG TPA: hypothetical protein VMD91_02500 [Candidatus Sulfotelmatobacter sp.]|nr:hypothetical protein [Candidatus Sulfotelmatobacter sp.]
MHATIGTTLRCAGALALTLTLLGTAAAPPRPGGGGGGGAPRSAPSAPRSYAPPARSYAPPARSYTPPQPVQRAAPQPGFDLHGDTSNSGRIVVPQYQPAQTAPQAQRGYQPIARRPPPNLHRVIVHNPHNHPNWGWHGGTPWVPVLTFWGGDFWGDIAPGDIGAQYPLTFVPIAPGSPGAELLQDYQLTQTDCNTDAPLVVIDGPDGSVICAIPNAVVGPGTYTVDPSTLTLESI